MYLRILMSLLPFQFLGHFTAAPPPALAYANPTAKAMAEQVVALVNTERARAGCKPLVIEARLTAAAQQHSADMAAQRFFAHEDKAGLQPWERAQKAGYSYHILAENIAAGYDAPEKAVNGWMHSPGHRANILNCDLTETGVGYAVNPADTPKSGGLAFYRYWTQDFGRPAGMF